MASPMWSGHTHISSRAPINYNNYSNYSNCSNYSNLSDCNSNSNNSNNTTTQAVFSQEFPVSVCCLQEHIFKLWTSRMSTALRVPPCGGGSDGSDSSCDMNV